MKVYTEITPPLAKWIRQQPMFFNASAPLSNQGHINLSPRGLDSLRIVDPNQVAILDLTGSGNETASHLAENGRMTVMFCAFEGEPQILRLYGEGEVISPGDRAWPALRALFAKDVPGVRQIFRLLITRVQTSCGYGVPLMEFQSQRQRLLDWATEKGEEGIRQYQQEKNCTSIDGLRAPNNSPKDEINA